jgi:hypothetical protein
LVVTALRHCLKLLVPAVAWAGSRADDQLIALHLDFNFIAQPDLINDHLGDTDSPRITYFDYGSFDKTHDASYSSQMCLHCTHRHQIRQCAAARAYCQARSINWSRQEAGVVACVAEAPLACVSMGAGKALENYAIIRRSIGGL